MSVLIKNATITDPASVFNGKKMDMFIHKGKIAAIGKDLQEKADRVITGKDIFVSPGWVDILADYREPGYEDKETIETGLNAAAAGGFTDVLLSPNTLPPVSTKSIVEYVLKKAAGHNSHIHVIGAVSQNIEGRDLAEMIDMQRSGAIAFSDGWLPVQDEGLMVKALEYVKAFDGILIQIPIHASLSRGGLMNESETSLRLGMSGIPAMSEALMVHRDLELLRYTGSRIHFSGISTKASLMLIKAAKKEGLKVSCSVTTYHLLFSDERLRDYDSVYKVSPPLRTEPDRKALLKALEDGTIDCIATHHRPQDWDAKNKEFEYAGYGMIGQETCWPMLYKAAPQIKPDRWVELLSLNPRKIFKLPEIKIAENENASLTVFDRNTEWKYNKENKQSKGINSPFFNQNLKGRAYTV
jgi:dihydroorotase